MCEGLCTLPRAGRLAGPSALLVLRGASFAANGVRIEAVEAGPMSGSSQLFLKGYPCRHCYATAELIGQLLGYPLLMLPRARDPCYVVVPFRWGTAYRGDPDLSVDDTTWHGVERLLSRRQR